MEKTTRQLAADIKAGRNTEQALPELMNRMASAYGMLSYYNMNMELSMLLESKAEGLIKPGRTVKELEEKHGSKVKKVSFRDKSVVSWDHSIKIDFEDGQTYARKRNDCPYRYFLRSYRSGLMR